MAQKVITVNIDTNVNDKVSPKGYKETELGLVNKYLSEGYTIMDKFSTVTNSENSRDINITFVLNK